MDIRSLPRNWVIDASIAGIVTVVEVAGASSSHHWHGHEQMHVSPFWYLPVLIGSLSLLFRRRYPVEVLGITLAAALWGAALNVWPVWLALVVAFFTAVLARRRAAAIASVIVGYLVSVWPPWLVGSRGHISVSGALGLLVGLTVLLSVAELFRVRSQRAAEIASRRAAEARRAASEQRLAIARDLHDVVAHNISVINVQAKTALHLMDRQPERAREALTAIHDVSRQALAELRSVLGVLRASDGSGAPLAPSPGLDRLGELASGTAGIAVRVVTDGAPRPVPAGVDVAAYRIVQEALTNSVRHSGGRTAVVRVRYDPDALEVVVEDDGRGGAVISGNGVAGMTERARALGGTFEAGPRPGGGFRVRAYLPAGDAS
ncbi:MAG TPA: sensor histidine kinase [Streptosporangiaceae bacterium]|nr:sensor histidine kinase [Streptosporangiaceae bacterium]